MVIRLLYIAALASLVPRGAAAGVTQTLSERDAAPRCVQPEPSALYGYRPHCRETLRRDGREAEMSYNAEGLRDKDYPPKPARGVKRVLLLGSVRVTGTSLPEADTLPRKLEKLLRGGGGKAEVINGGVDGYSPTLQQARLARWLSAYSPALVVDFVSLPEALGSDLMYAPHLEPNGETLAVRPRPRGWPAWLAKLLGGERWANVAQTWNSAAYRAYHTTGCLFVYRSKAKMLSCLFAPTFRALKAMQAQTEKAGGKFVLVFTGGGFSGNLVAGPAYDITVLKALDAITPTVSSNSVDLGHALEEQKIPYHILNPPPPLAPGTVPHVFPTAEEAERTARELEPRIRELLTSDDR